MAAGNTNSNLVTVFVLLLGSAVVRGGVFGGGRELMGPQPHRIYHVHVENGLKNNTTLNVHCKSKQDDLGEHVIKPGEHIEWQFRINLPGNTLFFCHVWGDAGNKVFDVFRAKDTEFIYFYCIGYKICKWSAREGGIFVFHAVTGNWDWKYNWDKVGTT